MEELDSERRKLQKFFEEGTVPTEQTGCDAVWHGERKFIPIWAKGPRPSSRLILIVSNHI